MSKRSDIFLPLSVSKQVTIGATSAQSGATRSDTEGVTLHATAACWIAFGPDPTAAATPGANFYLPAGVDRFVRVTGGEKIAVLQASAGGLLQIWEHPAI